MEEDGPLGARTPPEAGDVLAGGREGGISEEDGPVGPFPSWRWLYGTVVAWGILLIGLLTLLTRLLDPGAGP